MITIIALCYLGCVYAVFKVLKVRKSPSSIAVSVVIGVFLLGGIVIGWKQAAPMTKQMMLRRHVVQVIPDVREFVSKVHVEPDELVKKGDPIFDILPDRFQDAVDQAAAELSASKSTVLQMEAALAAAKAAVKKSEADTATAKAEFESATAVNNKNPGGIARLRLEEADKAYVAAQADNQVVKASLKQAQFALAAAKHTVEVSQAALNSAQFYRERCTYVSPVDGQVLNLQIKEQTPVARWRFTSTGMIMDLSDTAIIAVFPQNLLKNVKSGDVVEMAFKRRPGEVVSGKVEAVVKYTGEGQFMPSGQLPTAASVGSQGKLAVRIRLDDDELARSLPLGAAGTVAIYTDVGNAFHVISKITLRINAWAYYLPI